MKALGKHLLLELNDCDRTLLNDIDVIKDIMLAAAKASGATVLGESFHQFSPQGVSGVIIIAESHLSIHTWPEHGYAGADIFTCGTTVKPEKAAEVIIERMNPVSHSVILMHRGMIDAGKKIKK
ncbi:MAG: adenosylmethionine decarboxylase [Dehalococcoidales bacterium]|nr:adenosylmethionine decarboxylase [Dehalococcoidales bacterium]